MPNEFSFDITCNFDKQEFQNALDQARREIANRFDFKGVLANIEIQDNNLLLNTESEHRLNALIDLVESKLIRRGLPLSILDKSKPPEQAASNTLRKQIKLINNLDADQAKEVTKLIRQGFPKAKPTIQGETIRVSSRSKDELQAIMRLLKNEKNHLPLRFSNFH
jgi:hypothetical protein